MVGEVPKPVADDVQLRNVADDDLPLFFEFQRDPEAIRMAAFPARDWDAHLAHWTKILADASNMTKTILVDGQVAGNIASFEMFGKREVGYWIDRAFWGRGVATSALRALLALDTTRPLHAHVAKHNIGSLRVLQKCGFTITGEDEGLPDADGNDVEEFVLALTAEG